MTGDGEKGPRRPRRSQDSARTAPTVSERVAIVRRFLTERAWSTDQAEVLAADQFPRAVPVPEGMRAGGVQVAPVTLPRL
jgi:hypothetical protein